MSTFAGTGRNAACPCGSGKRYKNCHGLVVSVPGSPGTMPGSGNGDPADARQLLMTGLELQQRGDKARAKRLYERVLALDPEHPDAWHLLALLDLGDARFEDALQKVRQAIATLHEHPPYHITLSNVLMALGQPDKAEAAARAAVTIAPNSVEAWTALGSALAGSDAAAASAAWRHAINLGPATAEPHFLLGSALSAAGAHDGAISAFRSGLQKDADHPGLLNNLALALEKVGRLAEAEECFRKAIARHAGLAEARANLGNLLFAQQRFGEAIPLYESATGAGLDRAQLWANLGIALQKHGRMEEALRCFMRAAALQPDVAGNQVNVGTILVELNRPRDAIPYFEAALSLDPGHTEAENELLHASQMMCRWEDLDRLVELRLSRLRGNAPPGVTPFTLLSIPSTPADQLLAARLYVQKAHGAGTVSRPVVPWRKPERLRIGYLSSDFRRHPVTAAICELIELHDRTRCEVFAYAHGPLDASPERQRMMRAVDHWRDVSADPDAKAAECIRADRVHVLLDLNGHTQHARGGIAALRPAPVQVAYLGYPGTCGSEAYDYVLTDRFVCPPAQQANFTERFLYLPHCFMPGDTRRTIAASAPDRGAYGLPERGFVFCAFNNPLKIIPSTFDVWMRILQAVPGSVLWLRGSPAAQENLQAEAARRGVSPGRLVFAQLCADGAEHLARHRHADLFLDTLPYNAHSTANDALYAGLPVLTCAGETFASRVAGSQLHAAGLPELVTRSLAEYEAMALRLVREPGLLTDLRVRLAANRLTSPLFDMPRFARDFDDALARAWEDCAAVNPGPCYPVGTGR